MSFSGNKPGQQGTKSARCFSAWVTLLRVWSSIDGVPGDAEPTHAAAQARQSLDHTISIWLFYKS